MRITAEIERRGLKIAAVGIPKTIDNDIHFIDRSFGSIARTRRVDVIRSGAWRAMGARYGIRARSSSWDAIPASSPARRRSRLPMSTWSSSRRSRRLEGEGGVTPTWMRARA
jgi:hypothetical protein